MRAALVIPLELGDHQQLSIGGERLHGIATLKRDGETKVKVGISQSQAGLFKSARAGKRLKVLGRATIHTTGTEALFLENSLPITQKD